MLARFVPTGFALSGALRLQRFSSTVARALAAPLGLLALLGAFHPSTAAAQTSASPLRAEVNAPVRNFRLPVFDDDGHRQWDLQGAQALYVDRNEIRVEDMTLRTYGKDDPLNPRMLIQSPFAQILPVDNVARGPGYLYITEANNNYFIIGRDWIWDGRGQKVSIKSDVRVTFREKLNAIMD